MSFFYLTIFIISIILLLLLLTIYKKQAGIYFILIFVLTAISAFGYLELYTIDNLNLKDKAILANTIAYVGGCFIPILMLTSICDLTNFKNGKYLKIFFFVIAVIIFSFVLTNNLHHLFYKSIELIKIGNHYKLKKEYGIVHTIHYIYLSLIVASIIFVAIKSFNNKANVPFKTSLAVSTILFINILTFFLEKIINSSYELIGLAYILSEIILLFLFRKMRLYDVSMLTTSSLDNDKFYGFIVLDHHHHYLGANKTIKEWFKEVNKINIDHHINDNSIFLKSIHDFSKTNKKQDTIIKQNEKYYKLDYQILYNTRKTKILAYIIICSDDTKNQQYLSLLNNYNEKLEAMVLLKTKHLKEIQNDIILSMANIVENRDLNTGGHIKRTSDCIKIFVPEIKKSGLYSYEDEFYNNVITAAPLHDFGKIAIPDSILNKHGKFTDDEYNIMKLHPIKGAKIVGEILQSSEDEYFRRIAVNIAYYHHEKYDGSGYPSKLKGEEIPFEARIMALADVFDALVSKRCYKEKYSYEKAFNIISESLGTHFDPTLGKIFLNCRDDLITYYDKVSD